MSVDDVEITADVRSESFEKTDSVDIEEDLSVSGASAEDSDDLADLEVDENEDESVDLRGENSGLIAGNILSSSVSAEVGGDGLTTSDPSAVTSMTKQRAPACPLDLPFSVVRRLMKAAAPQKRFTPDMISAFSRGGGVFGLYLLSACQEAAETTGKRTIRPIDVVTGLSASGFPELAEEVRVALNIPMNSKKKGKRGNFGNKN